MRLAVLAIVIALTPSARAECRTSESPEAVSLVREGDAALDVNLDEAISKYEQAFQVASRSARVASKLAAAYEKKENWPLAVAALTNAVQLDPTNAALARRFGRCLAHTPAWSEARAALLDAVRLDPNWAEAHFDLGDLMWKLGEDQGALEHLTAAVRLGPTNPAHWAALADLYRRLGLVAQASKVVAEAPRFLKQADFDFDHVAARVHERAGEMDAAITSYESAKRACGACGGAQSSIHFDLGVAYARAKRTGEATHELQVFIKAICKGGAALRWADECTRAQMMLR